MINLLQLEVLKQSNKLTAIILLNAIYVLALRV